MLAMSTIDQTVIQRLLAAQDARRCQRGYLVGAVGLALLLAMLTYAGLGLFAFYQKHHNSLRPVWVVNLDNLDNQARRSMTVADRDRLWPELADDPQTDRTGTSRQPASPTPISMIGSAIAIPSASRPGLGITRQIVLANGRFAMRVGPATIETVTAADSRSAT